MAREDGMTEFDITISMRNVAEADATDLAQKIWDENAEDLDAGLGDFDITISRNGFPFDWVPKEAA